MPLRVLLANSSDKGGGAESVSVRLLDSLSAVDQRAVLVAGASSGSSSIPIPNWAERSASARFLLRGSHRVDELRGQIKGAGTVSKTLAWLAEPVRDTRKRLGHEDFYFPGTARLLELAPFTPDILHLHNLHGEYFDLRELSTLSHQFPTAVTLHDQWLMTGHCAYSLECQRWRDGCGKCPHLDTYPAIPRDATEGNLERKRRILSESRLHVSAPSQWLLNQVPDSILAEGVVGVPRLIPNGVDLSVFSALPRAEARDRLKLPPGTPIIVSAANFALSNPYKDWQTLREALRVVGERSQVRVLAFAVGESGPPVEVGRVRVEGIARVDDARVLADWYRSADVFVQPSAADNHPLTVLESLACGTPVVASSVGGIPEQIHHLGGTAGGIQGGVSVELATGVLVSAGDAPGLAACLMSLIEDPQRMRRLGMNAAADAKARFDFDRYVSDTLDWYEEILASEDSSRRDEGAPQAHGAM